MKRTILPIVFNLLVPGTGLVILGRPWLGLSLAGCFFLAAELGVLAGLVMPAAVPAGFRWGAWGTACGAWLIGQGLLAARIRFLASADLPRELAILNRLARGAMNRGDYPAARAAIRIALSADDTHVVSRMLRARLLTLTGESARARREWLRVQRLDVQNQHAEEIRCGLRSLHPD